MERQQLEDDNSTNRNRSHHDVASSTLIDN